MPNRFSNAWVVALTSLAGCGPSASPKRPAPQEPIVVPVKAPPPAERSLVISGLVDGHLEVSPDEAHIMVVHGDVTIATLGGQVRAHLGHCVTEAAFHPAGSHVVALGCANADQAAIPIGTPEVSVPLIVWSLRTGEVETFAEGAFDEIAFTRDGSFVAGIGPAEVRVFASSTGETALHERASGTVGQRHFAGGGVTLGDGPRLLIGQRVISPDGVLEVPFAGRIAPDGKTIASGAAIYDMATQQTHLLEDGCDFGRPTWCKSGACLAVHCEDEVDVVSVDGISQCSVELDMHGTFAFSASGKSLLTQDQDSATITRIEDCMPTFEGTIDSRSTISPDFAFVMNAQLTSTAEMELLSTSMSDFETKRVPLVQSPWFGPEDEDGLVVAFERVAASGYAEWYWRRFDPKSLAFTTAPQTFEPWETKDRESSAELVDGKSTEGMVTRDATGAVTWGPDKVTLENAANLVPATGEASFYAGNRRVELHSSGHAALWTDGGALLATASDPIGLFDVSSNGRLATLRTKGSLHVYNLAERRRVASLDPVGVGMFAVAASNFSPSGRLVAVSGVGVVSDAGKLVLAGRAFPNHPWSPDGAVVIRHEAPQSDSCGGISGVLASYDASNVKRTALLQGAHGTLGWAPDGSVLATTDGCNRRRVTLWRTKDWSRIVSVYRPRNSYSRQTFRFSEDSRTAFIRLDNRIRVIRLRDGTWLDFMIRHDGAALALDAAGRYDGNPAGLERVMYREAGSVLNAPLTPRAKGVDSKHCSGLIERFYADDDTGCTTP